MTERSSLGSQPANGDGARRTATERAAAHMGEGREGDGPFRFPLFGNLIQVSREGMLPFLVRSWHRYGDTFRIHLMTPTVVVCHPDGLQRVLAGNAKNYIKGRAYDSVREVIGEGVLALNGRQWRKRRALMQPKFHRKNLQGLVEIMIDRGSAYLDDLQERHVDGVVDVHAEMVHLTLDVVVNALFGRGLQEVADVDHEALGLAVELVSETINGVPVPKWLPTPKNRRFKRAVQEVEAAVYRIIAAAKRQADAEREDTLLQMLLDARDADTGEELTETEIRDEVFTLFIAGHETTALTLTWVFVMIDGRDDVKQRLRREVEDVLGGREPTFADLPKLTYTRQVIDETLRLRGPAALVGREAVADDNICGVKVRAGDMVMPFFWAAHRHRDYWERPEEFDPERFAPDAVAARDKWAYLPFSLGARVCIGDTFSLYESALLLAMMVQRFDVDLLPGQDLEPEMVATVRPRGGVRARLTWR